MLLFHLLQLSFIFHLSLLNFGFILLLFLFDEFLDFQHFCFLLLFEFLKLCLMLFLHLFQRSIFIVQMIRICCPIGSMITVVILLLLLKFLQLQLVLLFDFFNFSIILHSNDFVFHLQLLKHKTLTFISISPSLLQNLNFVLFLLIGI